MLLNRKPRPQSAATRRVPSHQIATRCKLCPHVAPDYVTALTRTRESC